MLEGAWLLRGILVALVLAAGAAVDDDDVFTDLIGPGDGPVRWPKQCGQMRRTAAALRPERRSSSGPATR